MCNFLPNINFPPKTFQVKNLTSHLHLVRDTGHPPVLCSWIPSSAQAEVQPSSWALGPALTRTSKPSEQAAPGGWVTPTSLPCLGWKTCTGPGTVFLTQTPSHLGLITAESFRPLPGLFLTLHSGWPDLRSPPLFPLLLICSQDRLDFTFQ